MSKTIHTILFSALTAGTQAHAAYAEVKPEDIVEHASFMDHGDGHLMDMDGAMVMGQNKDKLPPGCGEISEDVEFTVHAGHKYSKGYPGTMFGFDEHEWRVKPCSRLTVHFINEDRVRHQWMMHGLPKFLYDKGMFHVEVTGPAKISGTLILPAEDRTYLVHCDIAQHMEKGMKGQLIVGKGGAPFPSIPGLTDLAIPDDYGVPVAATAPKAPAAPRPAAAQGGPQQPGPQPSGGFILGLLLGAFGTPYAISAYRQRFQGMSADQAMGSLAQSGKQLYERLLGFLSSLGKGGGSK
jgi:plastocyanin